MAKIRFFGLLFSFFCLLATNLTPVKADVGKGNLLVEPCSLPAPDSFRITQVGGDFIKLAWKPIFPGALHQLTIMESDGNGGYVTILVENNVPGDTYNADNLMPGTGYRFILATKCASGDPSEVKAYIDGITLIVDLVISGRKPVNPIPVGNCEYIPESYDWVGFKVASNDGNLNNENYFEIQKAEPEGLNPNSNFRFQVKRHLIEHPFVAADDDGNWPNCDEPIIQIVGKSRFRIDKLINGGPAREIIGFVDLGKNFFPPSYYVCPDYDDQDFPWNLNYTFVPLVSQKTYPPQLCANRYNSENFELSLKLQPNIFYDNLELNLNEFSASQEEILVSFFNSVGQQITTIKATLQSSKIILNTSNLVPGCYIIRIGSKNRQITFRALKPI
ncbi:MAG: T9SS type A sorting domain-containing protein [Saprospiraceae bacterium]|nr:T9SS type A sorting domain-containing protein [Saprospiraceae bacterium]